MGIWLPPAEMSLLSWCCHKGTANLSISILHHCPLTPPTSLYHLFQTTNCFPAIPYCLRSVIFFVSWFEVVEDMQIWVESCTTLSHCPHWQLSRLSHHCSGLKIHKHKDAVPYVTNRELRIFFPVQVWNWNTTALE